MGIKPSVLCEDCLDRMRVACEHSCVEKNAGGYAFDDLFCAAGYDDVIKKCVHLFKYEGKLRLAEPLGKLMADFITVRLDAENIDLIVPVPLHPSKLRERQFNQSQLLASCLAQRLHKKIAKNKLGRRKYTLPQTELKRDERLKNMKGAFFAAQDGCLKDKTVLLVDDVFTTGATINECAKALKDAGAKRVVALALARGN